MYGFLISQDDIAHSGIIPWIPQRWAKLLGEPVEDVLAWLKELEETRYVITDEEVGELLVRSLIRRDDIWKQPNVFKAAAASAKNSKSPRIKAALYTEIKRLTLTGTNRETHALREDLLSHLEPFANPSPNPPEGFPRGSGDRSARDSGTPGEPLATPSGRDVPEPVGHGSVDNSARSGEPAGQNPSRTLSEPLANPSAGVTGKGIGDGYGPVPLGAIPHSPTPSPAPRPEPTRPLWPAAVPDVPAEEEGDSPGDEPQDVTVLVAEVRQLRQDWSTQSIRRVLADPSVRERPWPLVRRAMLRIAADPVSQHPGRLAHDGGWWHDSDGQRTGPRHEPLPAEVLHKFEPGSRSDCCAECQLPRGNRRHLEAS